jgi:long-chain acyl-CoA synthetase
MEKQLSSVSAILTATETHPDWMASLHEGTVTSWATTLDTAARLARGLRVLGIKDGDRVAILSSNSDLYLLLYLAIPWAGAILAPLNNRWSQAENAFALEDCAPSAIFVSDELAKDNAGLLDSRSAEMQLISLGTPRPGWRHWEALLDHPPMPPSLRGGDDPWGIFYTGGTTGRSKGVTLSQAGFAGNVQAMRALGVCPTGCRMLVVAPLFHLAAAAALGWVMFGGGVAVIQSAFDPAGTLDLIADAQVTDALLVPTMIQMMLDGPRFDPAKLKGVKRIVYGASPMPEATLDRIMAAAPHIDFYQAYGMTEVSCTATILGPELHVGEHRLAGRHRAAGYPIATAEIMIADEGGHAVPAGAIGEILVRGSGVMLGYWNQPELSAHTVRDGWMHTGDGGRIDEWGLLHVVDRLKDMIVSGGENVYSAEVESALALHPDVAQVAVIGVPDPRWGERVHAVVVPRPGVDLAVSSLLDHCRARIAGYKVPRSVELRTTLPLSAAGKILKTELRAPYWEGRSRNVA